MLDLVTAQFTAQGVPVVRYNSSGVPSSITVPFRYLRFSSDAKRKTSAYDRIGVTCVDSLVQSPDVVLEAGDIIIQHQGTARESKYLVGKLISEEFNYPSVGSQVTEWIVEALLCNVLVTVDRLSSMTTSNVTGEHFLGTPTTLYSNVPASLTSAQFYETSPIEAVKDEFLLRIPAQMDLNLKDIITITGITTLEHSEYQVQWIEPDSLGFTAYRIAKSRTDG